MYEIYKSDPTELPQTARLLALILQGANVDDFEPRILAQLYEVAHTYIVNILQDAQVLADHAGHKELSVSDIRLAIETRTTVEFAHPPSKKTLMKLAAKKNNIPLPLVSEKFGLRFPPERHSLLKQNITIIPKKRQQQNEGQSNGMAVDEQSAPPMYSNIPPHFTPTVPIPKGAIPEEDDYDMDGNYIFI